MHYPDSRWRLRCQGKSRDDVSGRIVCSFSFNLNNLIVNHLNAKWKVVPARNSGWKPDNQITDGRKQSNEVHSKRKKIYSYKRIKGGSWSITSSNQRHVQLQRQKSSLSNIY